jgi:hypothetical protein
MSVGERVELTIGWAVRGALAVLLLPLILVYALVALVAWPCARALSARLAVRPPAHVDPVDAIGDVARSVAIPA